MTERGSRVLLVRPVGPDRDGAALAEKNVVAESDAYISVSPCSDQDAAARVDALLTEISDSADWLVVTSGAAVEALAAIASVTRVADAIGAGARRGLQFAAVGPTSAAELAACGATDIVVPDKHDADGLLGELLRLPAARVVVPVGNLARPTITEGLRAHGWNVTERTVYETAAVARRPPTADRLAAGEFAVVVLRSPSAARAVAQFVPVLPEGLVAVCGGPTTAAAARELGFATIVVSDAPTAASIADAVARALADVGSGAPDGSTE